MTSGTSRANHGTRGANENQTPGRLLGYERYSKQSQARLRQAEHPNALPASWRCSARNAGIDLEAGGIRWTQALANWHEHREKMKIRS